LYRKQNFSLILRQMYMVVRVCECVVLCVNVVDVVEMFYGFPE